MNVPVFRYLHPVDGEIRLERHFDEVRLYCRWPFDLLTDEWIYLSNRFDAEDYARAVGRAKHVESVRIAGKTAGSLVLASSGSRSVELHATDAVLTGATQFITTLDVPIEDLIL